jgi:FtsP/CotA-like multicopper oxidase with cupredoxin domain
MNHTHLATETARAPESAGQVQEMEPDHSCCVSAPAASETDSRGAEPRTAEPIRLELTAAPYAWEVRPGQTVDGYAFNGQVPGPVIHARQGVPLEVRFTNALPEPTLIHWHGLRVPAPMDGTQEVQRPLLPGETFTYRFTPPDAGTFWYHPHANETEQLEKGLYGALIVHAAADPVVADAERVLVLDDVKLDGDGKLARFGMARGIGGFKERHDGREGDVRLVNGVAEPELAIAAGQVERWRIVNASSARYVRLSIGGEPFRILGTDGGLIEAPVTAAEVLLPAADRVELAVGPFAEGQVLAIEALEYDRFTMGKRKTERFATLRVGPARPSVAAIPERLRTIEPLADPTAEPTRRVKLGFGVNLKQGLDFRINGERHHHDAPARVGELQVWDLVNSTMMDHPFHLHGFFFQVLSVNGKAPAWRSWEDVVNVPPRSTVRIAWLPDDRPGAWMYHCHILEHHALGMMGHFEVVR